ncbi:MAG: phosphatase PAP2 family protein [Gemmatimonadales bacterium]
MNRTWRWLLIGGLAVAASHLVDGWANVAMRWPAANDRDWGRMLRILGFAPTWGLIALMLWLESRAGAAGAVRLRAAARAVVIAVATAGILAEVVKLLVRRDRPAEVFLGYSFRPFADRPLSTSGFGFPSSHAAVAFAGAAALGTLFPRVGAVLLLLAAGTGLTRIFGHAHFVSDVAAGALGGAWIGTWAARRQTVGVIGSEGGRPSAASGDAASGRSPAGDQ